jgi:hypothetical protein
VGALRALQAESSKVKRTKGKEKSEISTLKLQPTIPVELAIALYLNIPYAMVAYAKYPSWTRKRFCAKQKQN